MDKLELLRKNFLEFYPGSEKQLGMLEKSIEKHSKARKKSLKEADNDGIAWVYDSNTVGMMLYVDLFAGDLRGVADKIDYFKELGVTLIHLMPILRARDGENDGGYAVKDYREIDPKLGVMKDFVYLADRLHKNGMKICIDYVLNHTSKDHDWAQKAAKGDHKHQGYYMMYDTDEIPKEFEKTVPQVFPKVAPGNFTYYEDFGKWVFTSFYEFQWDLNYANPEVFVQMADTLLYLANKGADMIRLDAVPFMWKELGTDCRNLPKVHKLLAMFRIASELVAPSLALLGEAIVQPHEIVKYFGSEKLPECHIMYNASHMVEIWNSVATRDARHISWMKKLPTPEDSIWINYARCHDDIGWGLDFDNISRMGFDPRSHKQYLIDFFSGCSYESFAKGQLYNFDPVTMDARNCGTLASLAGLEKALDEKDSISVQNSIRRMILIHALILFEKGIPMLYSGDEIAMLNDYSYETDIHKGHDSRWLHRPQFNWDQASEKDNACTLEKEVFESIKKLIDLRRNSEIFNKSRDQAVSLSTNQVLAKAKEKDGKAVAVGLYNFSEDRQFIYTSELKHLGLGGVVADLISGRIIDFGKERISLGPCEYILLQINE